MPWSLSRLSEGDLTARSLEALEFGLLRNGTQRAYRDGVEIPWIDCAEDLEAQFLERLTDAHGREWSEFEAGATSILARVAASDSQDKSLAALSDDDLFDARSVAGLVLDGRTDARDRAWPEAFASGRIIVFERVGQGLRLRPPSSWISAPPFECDPLAEQAASASRIQDAANALIGKRHFAGISDAVQLGALRAAGSAAVSASLDTVRTQDKRSTPSPTDEGELSGPRGFPPYRILPNGASSPFSDLPRDDDPRSFAYLIAGDLPPNWLTPDAEGAISGGPLKPSERRIERDLQAWFRGEIARGRRWDRKSDALADLTAQADVIAAQPGSWKRMAERAWNQCAPDEWRKPGRPRRRPNP